MGWTHYLGWISWLGDGLGWFEKVDWVVLGGWKVTWVSRTGLASMAWMGWLTGWGSAGLVAGL
jgi:hypothetical protein